MKLRILIVEDDFVSRRLLQRFLSAYGDCDIAVNGREAVEAFRLAWEAGQPYDLICLDIMMPEMDGHEVLRHIREIEHGKNVGGLAGAKVIMTTALSDYDNIMGAFKEQCEDYIVKPINKQELLGRVRALHLIQ
jgi:two-component system chemotaxis response regulator CheY